MRKKPLPINSEPIKPGDWVVVVHTPEMPGSIQEGDVVFCEQVSPSRRQIRIADPDGINGYQFLSFDEVRLTLPPKDDSSCRHDRDMSLRHDSKSGDRVAEVSTVNPEQIIHEIKQRFQSLPVSLRHDILLSLRHDIEGVIEENKTVVTSRQPMIVWLHPAKRDVHYPWFAWGKRRVYIGGGPIGSDGAEKRVSIVRAWIEQGVDPSEIARRIKAKEF